MTGSDRGGDDTIVVRAWRVRDTGLAPAPARFRRLGGALRHHRGHGDAWPDEVALEVGTDRLEVVGVGSWSLEDVDVEVLQAGPPVAFVLSVPGAANLLAAPAGAETEALLARLG